MKKAYFTLVEIMTVLAIILVLAGSVFLLAPIVNKMNNDTKTRAIITAVSLALENYKNNGYNGGNYPSSVYPWEEDPSDIHYTRFYLDYYDTKKDEDDLLNPNNNMMQFFDIKFVTPIQQFDSAAKRYFLRDAYTFSLIYRSPGVRLTGYDLCSVGENGKPGTGYEEGKTGTGKTDGWNEVPFSKTEAGNKKGEPAHPKFIDDMDKEDEAGKYLGMGDDITNFNNNK